MEIVNCQSTFRNLRKRFKEQSSRIADLRVDGPPIPEEDEVVVIQALQVSKRANQILLSPLPPARVKFKEQHRLISPKYAAARPQHLGVESVGVKLYDVDSSVQRNKARRQIVEC